MSEAKARELIANLVRRGDAYYSRATACADREFAAALDAARAYLAAVPAPPAGPPRCRHCDEELPDPPRTFKGKPYCPNCGELVNDAAPAAEPVAQQPPRLKAAIERYWNMLGNVADAGECGSECHDALRALIAASKAESAAPQPEAPTLAKENLVHPLALKEVIRSVQRRVNQGDCPIEPPQPREVLEEAIVEMVHLLPEMDLAKAEPEAPQADDYDALMLSRLRASVGDSVASWALARIESDAKRIRELEQRIGEAENRIETDGKLITASRERERAAYERAAKMCEEQIGLDGPSYAAAKGCAAAIRSLAAPDSAASPTGGEG